VISINTIEHIGIGNDALDDDDDVKTVKEFSHILKEACGAIITVPHGKIKRPEHKVYDRHALVYC
jgi:hypothetical protein